MANYIASDTDLTAVANAIRAKSGGSSQLAFPAGFVSEIQAIPSGGGGMVPPVNALAQFEVSATLAANPTKMLIDISGLTSRMASSTAYISSLVLWRNDVVSATSYGKIGGTCVFLGRIAKSSVTLGSACTVQYSYGNNSSNSTSMYSSNSFSNNIYTLTFKSLETLDGGIDLTGSFKGVFTMLAPWKSEYTGTKVTTCPSGFLAFQ